MQANEQRHEQAVREAVSKVPGVTDVRVEMKEKRAWATCSSEVSPDQIVAAIQLGGRFQAEFVEEK